VADVRALQVSVCWTVRPIPFMEDP
jgi:hypothetical protein